MRPNKLKQLWQAGGAAMNGWLHIPNGWSAEMMAHQGYDSLTVDLQHGMMNFESTVSMFQAISTTDVVPLARAPWNEPGIIGKLLDAGAYGIICPMINTRAECEQFVGACRYFPDGYRSKGPTRASIYAGIDYAQHANDEIITIAMIETETALNNAEEICSVIGLDAIYVGPGDLSLTMGGSQGMDFTEPRLVAALERILKVCQDNEKIAGIHTANPYYAKMMTEKGWQFVTVSTDTSLMAKAAKQTVDIVKGRATIAKADALY